ncbi:MAG: hypothetical protein EP344_06160 [Bacteroidetes bacterium]|nr:MAG: hypothetical protein EP344_06160 [Bacteroidota bacterium]
MEDVIHIQWSPKIYIDGRANLVNNITELRFQGIGIQQLTGFQALLQGFHCTPDIRLYVRYIIVIGQVVQDVFDQRFNIRRRFHDSGTILPDRSREFSYIPCESLIGHNIVIVRDYPFPF